MTRAPGLTLVETLAATALLAALAAASAGLLRSARESLTGPQADRVPLDELSLIADDALRSPADHGLPASPADLPADGSSFPWPDAPDRPAITARLVRAPVAPSESTAPETTSTAARRDHGWIVFECAGQICLRWTELPEREDAPGRGGPP